MFHVRQAHFNDFLEIQACNIRNLPENYTHSLYLTLLMQTPAACLVAETRERKLVGYILGRLEKDHGYIVSLAVDLPWRHLGLATKLLTLCEAGLKEQPVKEIRLNTRASNKNGLSLYAKFGYVQKAVEKNYYENGEDAFLLIKPFNLSQ